jgi:hypothetical protein
MERVREQGTLTGNEASGEEPWVKMHLTPVPIISFTQHDGLMLILCNHCW